MYAWGKPSQADNGWASDPFAAFSAPSNDAFNEKKRQEKADYELALRLSKGF